MNQRLAMALIAILMAVLIGVVGFFVVPRGSLQNAMLVVSLVNLAFATYFVLIEAQHMRRK